MGWPQFAILIVKILDFFTALIKEASKGCVVADKIFQAYII